MKFSIRDLLLTMVIIGLMLGWIVDHYQLNAERETLWHPPPAGSEEAADRFLREKFIPYEQHHYFTQQAARLCFVPGQPLQKSLLSFADKVYPTKDPRFVGATEYEYWCNGEADRVTKSVLPLSVRNEGYYCVHVIASGSPPVILDVAILVYRY